MKRKLKIISIASGFLAITTTPLAIIAMQTPNLNSVHANENLTSNLALAASAQSANSNPISVEDITNMLIENIKYEKENNDWNGDHKNEWDGIEIEFVDSNNTVTNSIFDFKYYIFSKDEHIKLNTINNKLYWHDNYYQQVHWNSSENIIGNSYNFNSSANWTIHLNSKNTRSEDFVLNVDTTNHYKKYKNSNHIEVDDRYNQWTDWESGSVFEDTDKVLKSFFNMENSEFLRWDTNYPKVNNLQNGNNQFYMILTDAYKQLHSSDPADIASVNEFVYLKDDSAILNNPGFSDFYNDFIYQNIRSSVTDKLQYPVINDTYNLRYYDLPNPRGMFSQTTYWAFKGWKQTVKMANTFHSEVQYEANDTWDYFVPFGGAFDLSASKTFNKLTNWTNPSKQEDIKIKHHGQTLFTGTLAYQLMPGSATEYQIVLTDLNVAL